MFQFSIHFLLCFCFKIQQPHKFCSVLDVQSFLIKDLGSHLSANQCNGLYWFLLSVEETNTNKVTSLKFLLDIVRECQTMHGIPSDKLSSIFKLNFHLIFYSFQSWDLAQVFSFRLKSSLPNFCSLLKMDMRLNVCLPNSIDHMESLKPISFL